MKEFMGHDFLLDNPVAMRLYHEHAEKMPIFDFHCHLSPREIYEDKKYRSISEAWLAGDHYKWRLMREFGTDEKYVTGDADDYDKFLAYARVMPYAVGNPIYAWTHLELRRFFGIHELLSEKTAEKIYKECGEKLKTLTARKMIEMSNVRAVCTTDDPADNLEYHKKIAADKSFSVAVHPSFRPDKALHIQAPDFADYMDTLAAAAGMEIHTVDDVIAALHSRAESFSVAVHPSFRPDKALNIELPAYLPYLETLGNTVGYRLDSLAAIEGALAGRIDFFDKAGCLCADHGLEHPVYSPATREEVAAVVDKRLAGGALTADEIAKYKGYINVFLGRHYAKRGWVQQYHIGAIRNNSERNFRTLGPDTGFDAIGDDTFAPALSATLSALDLTGELPKTILYCLNPRDNYLLAAMMNCFQDGKIRGKVQLGSGWWFNDQKEGMRRQLEALMQTGLVSCFVGMLTDSRSFLSYTRHEYFRRILCSELGRLVEQGEYPAENLPLLGSIVEDICYNNAAAYFTKPQGK